MRKFASPVSPTLQAIVHVKTGWIESRDPSIIRASRRTSSTFRVDFRLLLVRITNPRKSDFTEPTIVPCSKYTLAPKPNAHEIVRVASNVSLVVAETKEANTSSATEDTSRPVTSPCGPTADVSLVTFLSRSYFLVQNGAYDIPYPAHLVRVVRKHKRRRSHFPWKILSHPCSSGPDKALHHPIQSPHNAPCLEVWLQ